MRLWTVRMARELASARWPLRASDRHVDPFMLPAYRWMGRQLARRAGPAPRGVRLPLWAWVKRPDLRESGHLPRGTPGVLVEIDLPDERVLVSEFDRFEVVLLRSYVARGRADDARFTREADRSPKPDWPHTAALRRHVEQSWQRIFTLSPRERDPRYWGPAKRARLQAVFWELPRQAVIDERRFIAR